MMLMFMGLMLMGAGLCQWATFAANILGRRCCQPAPDAAHGVGDAADEDEYDEKSLHG